ncbi:MAG TPA: hypothetical protein VFG29_04250 [Syntrophales bacterium]|nr:hypothetical protein [Syntrophales bacterium]
MSWFLSLLTAVGLATSDAPTKIFFSNLPPLMMRHARLGYAVPWLLAALLAIPLTLPDRTFWFCIAVLLLHEGTQGITLVLNSAFLGSHSRIHYPDGTDNPGRRDQCQGF